MKPYYSHDEITLYCADCREVLPALAPVDVIITDPVWPNALPCLAGSDDPAGLFAAAAQHFPRLAKRVVVQMGCDSDPRFLAGMPAEMPFRRACWLDYTLPWAKGRTLYLSDVAYVFGDYPPARPGRQLFPGRYRPDGSVGKGRKLRKGVHPCPRLPSHVRWLVRWFADGTLLDPFAGIGTTLKAAKEAGYPAIGIEINEEYCRVAVERLSQGVFSFVDMQDV